MMLKNTPAFCEDDDHGRDRPGTTAIDRRNIIAMTILKTIRRAVTDERNFVPWRGDAASSGDIDHG